MSGRRKLLTDRTIHNLPRTGKRRVMADPELNGLFLRIPPGRGPMSFTVIVKQRGQQTWETVGNSDTMGIDEARERARVVIKRIKRGEPKSPPPQSVTAVAANWLERYVAKRQLRTAFEYRRIVATYIVPHIGNLDFVGLRRSDIVSFLDRIEDRHGAQVADHVLSVLRAIASWVQTRSDDYVPPFVRGMRRVPIQKHRRSRILSDPELQRVWLEAEKAGTLGAIIRLLILTCQRREKIYTLRWQDIDDAGVWTISTEEGEKGNAGRLPLSKAARAIIAEQPHFASSPFVFPQRPGARRIKAFKTRCDCDFRLHDLRRQGRSLLSRIGIPFETAEAVLGHRPRGVVAVYDKYTREAEKGAALERLADAISHIVRPPPSNVTPLHKVASS